MKIHSVGAELFHAGIRTVMTKLIIVLHNFANVSKTLPFSEIFGVEGEGMSGEKRDVCSAV